MHSGSTAVCLVSITEAGFCIPATPQKKHTAYTVNYWVSGLKFTGPVLMAQRDAASFLTGQRDTFLSLGVFISP